MGDVQSDNYEWREGFSKPAATQAPPAAAVPADADTLEALRDYVERCGYKHWLAALDRLLAQQAPPAAAVSAEDAEAIKAIQEMMPPRDFRPSAQVWLTGNQVNELHKRLDDAAALAGKEGK